MSNKNDPVIYLCGGINGLSDGQCTDWRQEAKGTLRGEVLDPMSRDYRGKEDTNVDAIVSGDLVDIGNSDVLLVNATRPSWGTAMELVYARRFHRKIVAFVGVNARVSPWLRYHCDEIYGTLAEAVAAING